MAKILLVGESSLIATGYGVIQKNLAERFEAAGHSVAELAAGISQGDPRLASIPRRVYATGPHPENKAAQELFNKSPLNKMGEYMFEEVCLDFQPDVVCVPPGEPVMTENGFKNIEDIKSGDQVLTHKNRFMPVIKTMNRYHSGKINKIYINGCAEPLQLTPEHPVLIYKKKRLTNQKHTIDELYGGCEPEWVDAKDVKEGDLIVVPRPQENNYIEQIAVYDNVVNCRFVNDRVATINGQEQNTIPKNIKIDNNLCRLLGYYIGDGCSSGGIISFCFGVHELNFAEDVQLLIKDVFGLDSKIEKSKDKEMLLVSTCSCILADFLTSICGPSKNKRVPQFLWSSSNDNIEQFLCGWIRADGTYGKNTVSLAISYRKLAYEARLLCIKIGIPVNLSKINKNNKVYIGYRVDGYGSSAIALHKIVNKKEFISGIVEDYSGIKRARLTRILNNHMVASVRRNRQDDYNGKVYNLEVEEDNSYVLQSCVHNCSYTDPFMAPAFIARSPFRQFFHFICQAPVDGYPQHADWLYLYKNVDSLFTYTDWGAETLARQMHNPPNLRGSAYLCADYDIFKPLNKKAVRDHFGIDDVKILGMTARNQPRKAFEELFRAFRIYLDSVPQGLAAKSFLYLHTSYFDATWDLEYLLNKHGLYSKVLFTYRCQKCGDFNPLFACGPRKVCDKCGGPKEMTSPYNGVRPEEMNAIYNMLDGYIQLAYLEGFGVPVLEAAAAGLPLIVSDHTGTKDFVRTLGARAVKVAATKVETHTSREWGIPDVNDAAKAMREFFSLPSSELAAMGQQTLMRAKETYHWDKTAKIFLDEIDKVSLSNWKKEPIIKQPSQPPQNFQSATQMVEWGLLNVAHRPDLVGTALQAEWEKRLLNRVEMHDGGHVKIWEPKEFFQWCAAMRNHWNHWEQRRWEKVK